MIRGDVDPGLKELQLRAGAHEAVPVVARLATSPQRVPGLAVVSRFGEVVTGRATAGGLGALRSRPEVRSLKAARPCAPQEVAGAGGASGERRGVPGFTGHGVVLATIDFGYDLAHAAFRDARGRTRFLCLWDQRGPSGAESPAPFGYGRELTAAQIDAALREADPYAALGYDPYDADGGGGTHGTHVLDIAAGSHGGMAPGAALIGVHLRGSDTRPEDTLGDSVRLLEAVRYVVDRAGDRPLVLNLSLGCQGGPHDGSTLMEQALDALLQARAGLCVVMSAGNYGAAAVHAAGQLRAGERVELPFDVLPRDGERAELELWYAGADAFEVELVDPLGRSLGSVRPGESRRVRGPGGRTVATLHHRRRDPNNQDNHADLFLWPGAPAGRWVAALRARETPAGGRWHAWIERDDPASQSRFAPGAASATTTTNTICNGRLTVAVGAYDARAPGDPAVFFSSAGPTRDGRMKPDLSAPGAGIRAARSSWPGPRGRRLDGTSVKSGTSMAAPHVAGAVALMFEAARRPLEIEETREILFCTARRSADALRGGRGRLDPQAAVAEVCRRRGNTPDRRRSSWQRTAESRAG